MKYQENIIEVATLQPDFLGFIFYEKSGRFFDDIMPQLPKSIKKIGVFVNASLETILETTKKYDLQMLQLHGEEPPEYCKKLQAKHIEIIKVFSIKDNFNFDDLQAFEKVCDYYLFDTKGNLPGGNGYTFNWEILKNYTSTKPYFLSGGIGLENIEHLKMFFKTEASKYCYAIDVNSRFEITVGLKNLEALKRFKTKLNN